MKLLDLDFTSDTTSINTSPIPAMCSLVALACFVAILIAMV
jgi:hypothetical protein